MKTSVVIVSYRRMARLEEILKAWMAQCDDVWLCDCSEKGIPFEKKGFNYVHFFPDPGNKVRHAVATLTNGDIVIKADDDIMPLPGLVDDFIYWHKKLGDCISGIHGRVFEGPDYYNDTFMVAAHMQPKARRVDFLGIITCAPRKYLSMDLHGCMTPIEDLFWHNFKYPEVPKYVISTKHYNNKLPESRDAGRLCHGPEERGVRRAYYAEMWRKNYANRRPGRKTTGRG